MGSTLTNGIYLPAEGERNCYEGLAANWTALDRLIGGYNAHVGNATIHVTAAEKETWNGKADASALTAHTGDTTIHVTAEDKETWNGKADASALTAHTGNATIHVTAEDKQAWNGKADASALTAHTGDATIHVTSADKQAWDGHIADSVKHVTAEDKAKWNTVTSKADDSDVVHKSGDETVSGQKVFTDINAISNSAEIGASAGKNSFNVLDKNKKTISRLDGGTYSSGMVYSNWLVNNGSDVFNGVYLYQPSTNLVQLRPYSSTLNVQLGGSNRSFSDCYTSKVNGLEPSSLSLPSGNANKVIDISSYITNLDGTANSYTVPANGWISIAVVGTAIAIVSSSRSDSRLRASSGDVRMLYPVLKNETLAISVTGTTLTYARFIPCQGNV